MKRLFPYFPLLLIGLLAFLVRFIGLDNVPTATNFDQLHYLLDAKSFFVTGKDISGTVSLLDIFLFKYPSWSGMQAELPYLLSLLSVGPFNLSLTMASLPNVFLGLGTVLLMYGLGKHLVSRRFGLLAAAVAAINPWLLFSSRTVYEVVPATFFYLLTFYLLLKMKGKLLLLVIPAMTLAFYSYIGTKLIFLPFIIICLVYSYLVINKRQYTRFYATILVAALILVAGFVYQLFNQPTSRMGDIFLPNNPQLTELVNNARQSSLQSPVTSLFENKLTIYGRILLANTFNLLSPQYLFGEGDYFFSLGRHGLFYYVDALFLALGIISFFRKDHKRSLLFVGLLGVSILPQVFHNPEGKGNFTPHIALFIPLLIFVIASGIDTTLSLIRQRTLTYFLSLTLGIIYVISFANFLHIYFHQFPLQGNTMVFPNRVLAHYVSLASDKSDVIIHVSNPLLSFREYLFYSNSYNNNTVSDVNSKIRMKEYSVNNVTFVQCTTPSASGSATIVYDAICNYKSPAPQVHIPQLKDSGSAYAIFSDLLCNGTTKQRFLEGIRVSDLNVEKLSKEELCAKYIISY